MSGALELVAVSTHQSRLLYPMQMPNGANCWIPPQGR
jgi:hypothetical protein